MRFPSFRKCAIATQCLLLFTVKKQCSYKTRNDIQANEFLKEFQIPRLKIMIPGWQSTNHHYLIMIYSILQYSSIFQCSMETLSWNANMKQPMSFCFFKVFCQLAVRHLYLFFTFSTTETLQWRMSFQITDFGVYSRTLWLNNGFWTYCNARRDT